MRSLRLVYLLVLMLAVHGWCKPAGTTTEADEYSDDDPHSDYNDDETLSEDDEDGSPNDDDDAGSPDEPPQIISQPQSVHVRTGSTIKLPCLVKNIENILTTWQKDNAFLYSDKYPMTADPNRMVLLPNNTLVIYNASVNDSSDSYQCNILTTPQITITHRVRVDPRPTVPPPAQPHKSVIRVTPGKRVEASAGESITLGCETKIHPTPNIKWFHEDKLVDPKLMIDSSHITIKDISRHDAGHYQCLVEDGGADPPIAGFNVIVNYAPDIEAMNDLVHTGLGVNSELTCIVHAHPHANVVWYKGDQELHNERGGRIRMKANKTMHYLEIHRTEVEDLAEYRCVAVNNMGQSEKIIALTGAPSQAIIYGGEVTKSDTGLILKWRLESYSPITEYQLKYRRKGEENWNIVKPAVQNGSGNQFVVEHPIEGLQPGSYEAILMARNNFGWSQPSDPHTFTGEYATEDNNNVEGSAAATQPLNILLTLFLVLFARAFTSL